MKHLFFTIVAMSVSIHAHAISVNDLTIEYSVGSGPNQSFLIIDFDEFSTSSVFAFEYRWDSSTESPTGIDMLNAVAAGGTLSATSSGSGAFIFVQDISYLGNARGSNLTGEFWAYWVAEGAEPDLPNDWVSPVNFGAAARPLQDLSWDGWSIPFGGAPDFAPPPAPFGAVVPVPASIWFFTAGGAALVARAKKRRCESSNQDEE